MSIGVRAAGFADDVIARLARLDREMLGPAVAARGAAGPGAGGVLNEAHALVVGAKARLQGVQSLARRVGDHPQLNTPHVSQQIGSELAEVSRRVGTLETDFGLVLGGSRNFATDARRGVEGLRFLPPPGAGSAPASSGIEALGRLSAQTELVGSRLRGVRELLGRPLSSAGAMRPVLQQVSADLGDAAGVMRDLSRWEAQVVIGPQVNRAQKGAEILEELAPAAAHGQLPSLTRLDSALARLADVNGRLDRELASAMRRGS
jgi:hypothetical protein